MRPTSDAAGNPPPGAVPPPPSVFPAPWEALNQEIRSCTRCPLHATRRYAVIYRGAPRPKVLFVGEAPGAQEDLAGVPFVGRSGQRLDRAIATLGPSVEPFGVLNLIKCRPPANRFDPEAARACRGYLDRQIGLLEPEWIVPMGRWAVQSLLPGSARITEAAGRPVRIGSRTVFPLLHPAAVLHRPTLRSRWESDLAALRTELSRATVARA